MGALGNLVWFCCRDCGINFNRALRPVKTTTRKATPEEAARFMREGTPIHRASF